MSEPNITAQVVALTHLSVAQLREKWHEVFGEPTTQRHKQYMVKRIAWEIQRRASGEELSPEAKARLDELQDEFRNSPPETWFKGARHNRPQAATPAPRRRTRAKAPAALTNGTVLTRDYKGQRIVVTARGPREFEWQDTVYASLSAVAKAVTGSHCSGNAFFGLTKKGGAA
ncbi:MAG: DUF2924 domain-containing protein [bacterium]|nr:DUF2924 domain-containing protein [bacterium]